MPFLTHFSGGDEQQDAFDWLKQRDRRHRPLAFPRLRHLMSGIGDIHEAVDASEGGVGGVLYQLDTDGKMQIAAFASRSFNSKLNQTERKWSTLEQERYALLH